MSAPAMTSMNVKYSATVTPVHSYRRTLEVEEDLDALEGGGEGEAQRREQLFQAGVGDHRGETALPAGRSSRPA